MAFYKYCPGCLKQFEKNRARKRHVLGYTNQKGVMICTPCPQIADHEREKIANEYTVQSVEQAA